MVVIGTTLWLIGGYGNAKSYVPDVWCLLLGDGTSRSTLGQPRNRWAYNDAIQ